MRQCATLLCRMVLLLTAVGAGGVPAAQPLAPLQGEAPQVQEGADVPAQVEVTPDAADEEIASRLERILNATGWFQDVEVRVDEGVVFLSGRTDALESQEWATRMARNTRDVVAVVNRIELTQRPLWDFTPAREEVIRLWRRGVQSIPLVIFAAVVLALAWLAARGVAAIARHVLRRHLVNALIREVIAKAISIPVFLVGLYLVLQVAGLTRLALTVVGGTGIAGLILGIAFRDIMENYLASILLSVQNPFRTGDLIEIEGRQGFVQRVTTRGTLLMALDGSYVQIPNATIYKSIIRNLTANPLMRLEFGVGIGYDAPIARAQEVAMRVLREHPAVLNDPEPMVLVEQLAAATANLRIYFWLNSQEHSALRVRSAVIRLTKRAFQDSGISMPDEAREVIFPQGVPVVVHRAGRDASEVPVDRPQPPQTPGDTEMATPAEGGLRSEAPDIEAQAIRSRPPEGGANLLTE